MIKVMVSANGSLASRGHMSSPQQKDAAANCDATGVSDES